MVIPVFNGEAFIGDAIQSCFDQSYKPLEVIVIDDGSTDSTVNVARIPGVTIIQLPRNMGAAEALRVGFERSRAKYVCWLSSDDMFIDRDKVKKQVAAMDESGADWSYFKTCYVGVSLRRFRQWNPRVANLMMMSRLLRPVAVILNNPVNASSVMIRQTAIRRFGNFDPSSRNFDADAQLWFRYAVRGAKLRMIEGAAVLYREHPGQTSKNKRFLLMLMKSRLKMVRSLLT